MNVHKNARLRGTLRANCEASRERTYAGGRWPKPQAFARDGSQWIDRYCRESLSGLVDRSPISTGDARIDCADDRAGAVAHLLLRVTKSKRHEHSHGYLA